MLTHLHYMLDYVTLTTLSRWLQGPWQPVDSHGRRPGTYFQGCTASSHFLGQCSLDCKHCGQLIFRKLMLGAPCMNVVCSLFLFLTYPISVLFCLCNAASRTRLLHMIATRWRDTCWPGFQFTDGGRVWASDWVVEGTFQFIHVRSAVKEHVRIEQLNVLS